MDMMKMHEYRCDQTHEHMLKVIDEILDEGHLTGEDIRKVKDAWKAIYYARMSMK